MKMSMSFPYIDPPGMQGDFRRNGLNAKTTYDAIIEGDRTATTRFPKWYQKNPEQLEAIKSLSPGAIVTFTCRNRKPILAEVVASPLSQIQKEAAIPPPVSLIISGGQTGADQGGLLAAKALGINTGGVAPKGWKTETGANPKLAEFGLQESYSVNYSVRTEENVKNSNGTLLIGDLRSPGSVSTMKLLLKHKKPFIVNPSVSELRSWLFEKDIQTLNVAGNRESVTPGIANTTTDLLIETLTPHPEYENINGATYILTRKDIENKPNWRLRWCQLEGWNELAALHFFNSEPTGVGYQFQFKLCQ